MQYQSFIVLQQEYMRLYSFYSLLFHVVAKTIFFKLIEEEQVISVDTILHPILLPRVHSALFVLYALHNKKEDDAYWERLMKWYKQPDITLMAFLEIDQKILENYKCNKHFRQFITISA